MMKQLRFGIFSIMLLPACFAAAVAASPAPPPRHAPLLLPQTPGIQVKSLGVLEGHGKGVANVTVMKGTLKISGKGTLTVSNDAHLTVKGVKGKNVTPKPAFGEGPITNRSHMPIGPRITRYEGFNGEATVSGEKMFTVTLRGEKIVVKAQGAGMALMLGEGSYSSTKNGSAGKESGKWSAMPKPPQGQPGKNGKGGPMPGARPRGPMPTIIRYGEFVMPHPPQSRRNGAPMPLPHHK